jgi:superfamily I DNA/RNA helicase
VLAKEDVLGSTGRVPRPLLDLEERFLLEDLKGEQFGTVRDCKKRLQAFNAAWARLQHEESGWCTDPTDRDYRDALLAWLKFHRSMLIGEVVPELLKYLRGNPMSKHRGAFKHVLVDEYQDLNKAEQDLLDIVAEKAGYSIIGDDDQSIYSFKHAHPEGIIQFPERHITTHNEEMNECWRCPKRVVAMANSLIVNNTIRSERTLQPRAENPDGEIYLVQWLSMNDEAKGVARFIAKKIENGEVVPGQVLVLAPRRQFGYLIRDELNARSVPAHSFFAEEIFDGDITKKTECAAAEAYAILCLLADPQDRTALRVWCGLGSSDLRRPAWDSLRGHCETSGLSPRQALDLLETGGLTLPIHKTSQNKLVERYKMMKERLAALQPLTGTTLFSALFPTSDPAMEPLRGVATKVKDEWDAKKLYETVSAFISQPELPADADYVRVMSLHKSKGLTADCVVVTGCIEGALPRVNPDLPLAMQHRALEEQRRLMYVALTRTRKILMLSSVITLPRALALAMNVAASSVKGADIPTQTSRFIAELGSTAPAAIMGTQL